MNKPPSELHSVFRRHHLLALVPLLALLFSPYIANRLEPRILGMPFLLGWIVVWVVLTSVVMFVILRLDGDSETDDTINIASRGNHESADDTNRRTASKL